MIINNVQVTYLKNVGEVHHEQISYLATSIICLELFFSVRARYCHHKQDSESPDMSKEMDSPEVAVRLRKATLFDGDILSVRHPLRQLLLPLMSWATVVNPLAVRAPFNDLQLMKVLKEYPHEKVAHAAQAAISRHLWYLSEHLIGLSLFDDRIDTETKKNMVQNFQCPKKQDFSRRIVLSDETPISNVASFVTERTLDIFDVLTLDGKERAQLFLIQLPGFSRPPPWASAITYQTSVDFLQNSENASDLSM
ncbi:hypothetical protein Hamer_G009940 [Homarus americanus]|uniref:Uncharacterized protein n=1 Tax=Homarus americanus TaxID=6706 RepID=A0A8J5NA66_HOMAM|nr:hypothetical protein Hamer_G009940 [Homarus americanus]